MRALIAVAVAIVAAPLAAQDLPDPRDLLEEINAVRNDPRGYARQLRRERRLYDGRLYAQPGSPALIRTSEGVAALDEAIGVLERQPPLPPLGWGDILATAARDHATSQGRAGARGHIGSDRSTPGTRVRRRGGDIYVGEAIGYGPEDAYNMVRILVVDDGVRDRGHRKLLLSPMFRYMGADCAPHRALRTICVIDVAATPDGRPAVRSAE